MPLMGRLKCLMQPFSYLFRQTQTSPSRMADSSSNCRLTSMKSSYIKNTSFSFWYIPQSSLFTFSKIPILSLRIQQLLESSILTRSQYWVASSVIRKMKCEYTPIKSFLKYLQMRFSSIIIPPRCLERLIAFHCNQGHQAVFAPRARLQLYLSWMIRCRQRQKGRSTFSTSSRITPLEGCCWIGTGVSDLLAKFWRSWPISLNTPPRLLVNDFRSFSWMACTAAKAESASNSLRQPPSAALWRKMWTIANFLNVFVRRSCPPLPSITFKVSLSLSAREGVQMRGYFWWKSSRLASFSVMALKVGSVSGVSVSVRKWWFLRMRWCSVWELGWVMWAPIDRNILLELIEYYHTLFCLLLVKNLLMKRFTNSLICACCVPSTTSFWVLPTAFAPHPCCYYRHNIPFNHSQVFWSFILLSTLCILAQSQNAPQKLPTNIKPNLASDTRPLATFPSFQSIGNICRQPSRSSPIIFKISCHKAKFKNKFPPYNQPPSQAQPLPWTFLSIIYFFSHISKKNSITSDRGFPWPGGCGQGLAL